MKNLKLYDSFLWMDFNCLKATEPLQGDSLKFKVLVFFTTQSPGVPGTHLINFDHMKVEITLVLKPPSGLEFGTMYWEFSILTTKIIGKNNVKCKCTVFTNIKQTLHYVR